MNPPLVTNWCTEPREVLARNFGVPAETFAKIPLHDLWIFQGTLPGDLAADRAAASKNATAPPYPFVYQLVSSQPVRESSGGNIRVADSVNFNVSTTIAAALVTFSTRRRTGDALASECR